MPTASAKQCLPKSLGLGDALGSAYGIYEGWGFAIEDSTLKFKQLA